MEESSVRSLGTATRSPSVDVFVESFDWDLGVHAEEVVAVESALGALV
jgi:hypothetical protein